ncbi:jg18799 [Pararge aegeria aegeria]|uniref:Jg18799 protein n=1 Tax=Pararge aegeria aegeria TaxID=348720 RepID=A0A8S4S861_9NEOP|nr:jg18799 [Pararge aegeria aegeria]
MPIASNFAITSNTLSSLITDPVYKTNYNYYTDYLSNFLDIFLPAITKSIISAFLEYNLPKQSKDSFTPPIENTTWILSKVYSKPNNWFFPSKAFVNSNPFTKIEQSGTLSTPCSETSSLKTVNSETQLVISPIDTPPVLYSEPLLIRNTANKLLSPAIPPLINTYDVLQPGLSEISILKSNINQPYDSVTPKLSETPILLPMPISDLPPLPKKTGIQKPLLGLPWKDTSSVGKLSENISDINNTDTSMPYIASITINMLPPKNTADHIVIVV